MYVMKNILNNQTRLICSFIFLTYLPILVVLQHPPIADINNV